MIALSFIRADEINYARARNAGIGQGAANFQRIFDLTKNLRLYVFAGCIFLFQLADASMLPVLSQNLALGKNQPASLLVAGLIVTPQIIAAILSPWIGYHSEKYGRKPLLLIGFGVEVLRGLVFAVFTSYPVLVVGQCLGGISAAASGFLFEKLGHRYGFVILSAAAVAATALLWTGLTETKPGKYID
jgi:MFS family permease